MPKEWEKVRQALANGTHVDTAKRLLSKMTIIRILVASGPGFGDQTIALNVEKHLRALGFTGLIEMIAPLKPVERFFHTTHESPLLNLLKLYNARHLFKHDYLQITDAQGFKLIFYDYAYFQKNLAQAVEVDLALYPGYITWFKLNYETAWFGSNFEHNLAKFSKSKRAIYLNFFTLRLQDLSEIGYISQLKHQEPRKNYDSQVLTYPVHQASSAEVHADIKEIGKDKPQLSETLQSVFSLQTSEQANTFAVYSTHHLIDPEFTLVNLIIGSSEFNARSNKPLLILLLSPISNESWRQLKQMVNNQTRKVTGFTSSSSKRLPPLLTEGLKNLSGSIKFLDALSNQTLASQLDNSTIVIRLPSLASSIFNALFVNSTYPPLYEGVNAANSLKSANRFGTPCPKMERGEIGVRRSAVADYLELPAALKEAGMAICSSEETGFFDDWKKSPTPAQRVVEVFNFTNSTERMSAIPGDDRVTFAIAKVGEEKLCGELELLAKEERCDLIEFPLENKLLMAGRTLAKGLAYGSLEASFSDFFRRTFCMRSKTADSLARVMQLSIQGLLEGDWSHLRSSGNILESDWLVFAVIAIELLCLCEHHGPLSKIMLNCLMFAVVILPKIWSADSETLLFAAILSGIFVMAHNTGRNLMRGFYNLTESFLCANTTKSRASHPEPLGPIC